MLKSTDCYDILLLPGQAFLQTEAYGKLRWAGVENFKQRAVEAQAQLRSDGGASARARGKRAAA
jgi:hypothetical protein